jgi:hypothetical protein
MSFYSITTTQWVWIAAYVAALVLPWIIVGALPLKELPPIPPPVPRIDSPPSQPDRTDMPAWDMPDWLRNPPRTAHVSYAPERRVTYTRRVAGAVRYVQSSVPVLPAQAPADEGSCHPGG